MQRICSAAILTVDVNAASVIVYFGIPKAIFAEKTLANRLAAKGFEEELSVFRERLGKEFPYPRIVVAGLDEIDGRHEAQSLWPDLIIGGAIGDFSCQVSRHEHGADDACMICLFRKPSGPSAESVAIEATGLSAARLQRVDDPITLQDVESAPADRQEWLRQNLGRRTCSVVSKGVAQLISQQKQRDGFAPSVPFVAGLSASMAIGELVKFAAGLSSNLQTRFQFDALQGPGNGTMLPQEQRRDCNCVSRARTIAIWREQRSRVSA